MHIPVVYIGFAQALFAALVIFLKKPLKFADVILALWLIAIAGLFGLNVFQDLNGINEDMWHFSLSLSMSFPPFLFLYSKYITVEFEQFNTKDLLHAIPFFLTILLILVFRNSQYKNIHPDGNYYNQLNWLRNYIGAMFIVILWLYGILAVLRVQRYKKQIKNNYSFRSDKISLNWLLFVLVSFIISYNLIVVLSMLQEIGVLHRDIDQIRNVILLVYVYVVSLWGYRQNQLSSEISIIKLNSGLNIKSNSLAGKYKKSGLKPEQAKQYQQQLIHFMNKAEIWKDPELSIAKLGHQTNIPKHHITQTLNEDMGKNFYNFVNEYRVEAAKKLLVSPEFASWSIVAIAYECGFNSKTAFNNFFKKYTGMTPSEFKRGK